MKWKNYMPYWIYFITMFIVQILVIFAAPIYLLFLFALLPFAAAAWAVIVGIVGNTMQKNLGNNSRKDRILIAVFGSFFVVMTVPLCLVVKNLILLGRLSFYSFLDEFLWVTYGCHCLVLYLTMEVTYLLHRKDWAREKETEVTEEAEIAEEAEVAKEAEVPEESEVPEKVEEAEETEVSEKVEVAEETEVSEEAKVSDIGVADKVIEKQDKGIGAGNQLTIFICSIFVMLVAVLTLGTNFKMNYAKTSVKESYSDNGAYQVIIYQRGEPEFPFGGTHCRIVLKQNDLKGKKIKKYDFSVSNDGCNVSENNFAVQWKEDCVEIISSGWEQPDELITISFAGKVSSEWVYKPITEMQEGKEGQGVSAVAKEDGISEQEENEQSVSKEDALSGYEEDEQSASKEDVSYVVKEDAPEMEETYIETKEIEEGYREIYRLFFEEEGCDFIVDYNARGDSSIILREDEEMVEFLVYDRPSANAACELYVLYQSQKDADGAWSPQEAKILDIYAYHMPSKEVVQSGKTAWAMSGSEEYCDITGEN